MSLERTTQGTVQDLAYVVYRLSSFPHFCCCFDSCQFCFLHFLKSSEQFPKKQSSTCFLEAYPGLERKNKIKIMPSYSKGPLDKKSRREASQYTLGKKEAAFLYFSP